MRFFKMVPVIAITAAVAVAACAEEGAVEEGTELTPADTAMTTPPPAPDMGTTDTIAMDEGDTIIMMDDDSAM